tara:strand:- start:6774 stop:7562 length:789 start_codon:yes stop_codon:yes gene_type:complete
MVSVTLILDQERPLAPPSLDKPSVTTLPKIKTSIQNHNQSKEGQLVAETRKKIRQMVPIESRAIRERAEYLLKKVTLMAGEFDNQRILHGPARTTPIIAAHILVNCASPTPLSTGRIMADIDEEFCEKGLGPFSKRTAKNLSRTLKKLLSRDQDQAGRKRGVRMEREDNLLFVFSCIAADYGHDFYASRSVSDWISLFAVEHSYPSGGSALTAFHRECAYLLLNRECSRQSILKLTKSVGNTGNFDHWSDRVKRLLALEEPK